MSESEASVDGGLCGSSGDVKSRTSGSERNLKWWVAVNGASVSPSPFPLASFPTVIPTPQLLIGFSTVEEQQKCLTLLLEAPLDVARLFVREVLPSLERGGVVVTKKYGCPGSPSEQTVWLSGGEGGTT